MATILLLIASNVFMTIAWYWHLKAPSATPLLAFIAISWLIALPEYCLAVPANRIGHVSLGGPFTAPQLKLIQEAIALVVFIAFSLTWLKEAPRWQDYAGIVLILAGLGVALSGRHESHEQRPLAPAAEAAP
jgi:uncharacterized protein (DUF486 family)